MVLRYQQLLTRRNQVVTPHAIQTMFPLPQTIE